LPTICNDNEPKIRLREKIKKFKKLLKFQSFILLARPKDIVYTSEEAKKKFVQDLNFIIEQGLLLLEIPWVYCWKYPGLIIKTG